MRKPVLIVSSILAAVLVLATIECVRVLINAIYARPVRKEVIWLEVR